VKKLFLLFVLVAYNSVSFATPTVNIGVAQLSLGTQWLNDTLIVHNYDHGGIAFTLSWGTAIEAVDLMEKQAQEKNLDLSNEEIAVIGSGPIGLTTAYILVERGYKVHMYARSFPPDIIASAATVVWSPSPLPIGLCGDDAGMYERIVTNSYNRFKNIVMSLPALIDGVELKPLIISPDDDTTYLVTMQRNEAHEGQITTYGTILIRGREYLCDMFNQLKAHSVKTDVVSIKDKSDLLAMQHTIFFNCMGFGGHKLFKDDIVIR